MTSSPDSSTGFRRLSLGVAVYTLFVILWGYFLRISESGDGCGTDWPLCHGEVLPGAGGFSTFVEFSHRLTSGVVLLAVLAMAVVAFRSFPRGHALRFGAGAALVLTLTESLFGAILVVFGWVAGDISLGRILIRPVHVTNTFLLMAALVLTAWWAARGVRQVPWPLPSRLASATTSGAPQHPALDPGLRAAGAIGPTILPVLGVLLLAWTGAWTGLAVTAFPAETFQDGVGQYLDPEHILIYLRMSHPILAVIVIAVLARFALRTRSLAAQAGDRALHRAALAVGGLAGVQLIAGPVTILLGNPAWMRLVHLLLADLLWAALVVVLSARFEIARRTPRAGSSSAERAPAIRG